MPGGGPAVLRRVLLAASASQRAHDLITTAPVSREVVRRFVAGHTARDALAAPGLDVTLDYLGEHTADRDRAAAVAAEYVRLLGRLRAAGLADGGRAEVSV